MRSANPTWAIDLLSMPNLSTAALLLPPQGLRKVQFKHRPGKRDR